MYVYEEFVAQGRKKPEGGDAVTLIKKLRIKEILRDPGRAEVARSGLRKRRGEEVK